MKKIYSLILASAVAVSVSAMQPVSIDDVPMIPVKKVMPTKASYAIGGEMSPKADNAVELKKSHLQMDRERNLITTLATPAKQITGDYTWTSIGYLTKDEDIADDNGVITSTLTITKTSDTDLVITGIYGDFPVKATWDADKNTITIQKQVLFYNTNYKENVYFQAGVYDDDWNETPSDDPIVGEYDPDTKEIIFDPDQPWMATITLDDGTGGYFLFRDNCELKYIEGTNTDMLGDSYTNFYYDTEAKANKYAYAMYIDINLDTNVVALDGLGNWGVNTLLGNTNHSDVKNIQGIYDAAAKTITIPAGQMIGKFQTYDAVFCFMDEDKIHIQGNIVFTQQENGNWTSDKKGIYIGAFSGEQLAGYLAREYDNSINLNNARIAYNHYSNNALANKFNDPIYLEYTITNEGTTMATGNIVPYFGEGPALEWPVVDNVATVKNVIGYTSSSSGDFYLQTALIPKTGNQYDYRKQLNASVSEDKGTVVFPQSIDGLEADFRCALSDSNKWFGQFTTATITGVPVINDLTESAIDTVITDENDNSNAPVEFFNLQGMRVANPAAGQIVIRRQGTATSKVLVR